MASMSLKKCNFSFFKNYFCRPGTTPSNRQKKKLGVDYFTSEESFRKHLCAYGVNCNVTKLSDDEQDTVKRWVRLAIVDLDNGSETLQYSKLPSQWSAIQLLCKMGLSHEKSRLESWFVFPLKGQTRREGINAFREEGTNPEMFNRLARFGVDGLDKSLISKEELLGLQLYLTEPANLDTL